MAEAAGPRSDTQCEPTTTEGSAQPPQDRAAKRLKMEGPTDFDGATTTELASHDVHSHNAPVEDGTRTGDGRTSCSDDRRPGLAPIKKEYLIDVPSSKMVLDDDVAEGRGADDKHQSRGNDRDGGGRLGRKKDKRDRRKKGQNTERTFGKFDDAIRLCSSRAFSAEFSPRECKFGDRCKLSHDIRKYLAEGRRADVETFGGRCPVFDKYRTCPSGWKCRFVKSHMCEVDGRDGRKELVLLGAPGDKYKDKDSSVANAEKTSEEAKPHDDEAATEEADDSRPGIVNTVALSDKILLSRKRLDFTAADQYITWLDQEAKISHDFHHRRKEQSAQETEDLRAGYADPPLQAAEKRRLYFGPETPTLAPLTTQGNLPFRRLCVELGCQLTYSEMAMSMPLLQGSKSDWTLMKAHESEALPPKFSPGRSVVLDGYDNAKDLRFGAQISGNKPWMVTKAVDVLNRFCPHLRLIDLNCGCPIDMVYKSGGGSALLEAPGKMERMIRGMNAMSGPIPITAKIRTGVTNNRPTATQLLDRLAFGGREHRSRLGAPGCAAVTLHGRSREQRYTKKADWAYIGECAALIQSYNSQKGDLTDTAAEPDERTLANTKDGRIYFLGNGDCYSHVDYFDHIEHARVDSVMIGRGALIKPWIFEEIDKGQYLDKSSTERLAYVDKFVRYGLDAWGSDELGIGFTRRFLLEWMSFAHRYVPVGLLEHLPPSLNDRPPAYRGRDELETLMASENYRDWIKISEMFLGPAHPDFQFQPKHRSNAYEAEG